MLMGILFFIYDVTNGAKLFTPTKLSLVADTISLRWHYGLKGRSHLEIVSACSSQASCLAFGVEKQRNNSFWCACPKQIMWPGSWNYAISTMHIIHDFANPLTGMNIYAMIWWWSEDVSISTVLIVFDNNKILMSCAFPKTVRKFASNKCAKSCFLIMCHQFNHEVLLWERQLKSF